MRVNQMTLDEVLVGAQVFLLSVPLSMEAVMYRCLGKGGWVTCLDGVRHKINDNG